MTSTDIRWKQRFENFSKAFKQLSDAITLSNVRELSQLEQQGLIQAFEYTFELAWNTLKDYLIFEKVEVKFPREVIKTSFKYELIDNGEIWLDMLDKRNLLSHTYEESTAELAFHLIVDAFYPQLLMFYNLFKEKNEH